VSVSLVLCFLVASSFQYGILRVEEIWSNDNIPQVKIEDMIVEESQIFIDYIEDLSGGGVTVEDILFSDGSITIPGDFQTCCGVEFLNALNANQGVFADAGAGSNEFSFTIDDNTGDVFVLSDVRAQGGINASNRFFVDGITGETRIEEGLVRANGGLLVQEDQLSLSADGDITTAGNVQVAGDVFFGELSSNSPRTIGRIETTDSNGGSTYLVGQDAAESGGDLILEPGDGNTIGNIFLASSRNSELFFGRSALSNSDNGGRTSFLGQNSFSANGGDLFFDGGNSGAIGFGGDILLAPGLASLDGRPGKLLLGSTNSIEAGHDVLVGRSTVEGVSGTLTTYKGQSSTDGAGGSFYLRAGDVVSGTGNPGDLILTAGVDGAGTQTVFLGKNTATRLNIRRVETIEAGGATFVYGQNATGTGGDLYFRGGSGPEVSGDLYLVPGSSVTGNPGDIVLGLASDAVEVRRPVVGGAAAGTTTISGQEGFDGVGGDLFFIGGDGISQGGDVVVLGGEGITGGNIDVSGGNGINLGGEVTIRAGHGGQRNGGEVTITTADGPISLSTISTNDQAVPGSSGSVIVGPAAARLYVDEVPIQIIDADIVIMAGNDVVTISADAESVVSFNGATVLKQSQNVPDPTPLINIDLATIRSQVAILSQEYDEVLQALNQCGHGLVTSITQPDNVVQQCPTP